MLYPAQSQRVARFGTAPAATLWTARLDSPDPSAASSLPSCDPLATRLCLEVSLTSEFAGDPFVLAAFEAATPLQSLTFDNVSAAMTRPVVQGTTTVPTATATTTVTPAPTGNGSDSDSSTTPAPTTTLWRFHADTIDATATTATAATTTAAISSDPSLLVIDVLLRLRQLSQWDARRDQVLVHARVTQRRDGRAVGGAITTAVEALTLYGNAVVTHRVTRARSNQMRLALALTRNASAPDVTQDVTTQFPPAAAIESGADDGSTLVWTLRDADCARCSALLLGCSADSVRSGACSFETSSAALPTCLRETQGLTPAWFQSFLALHQLGHYEPGFPVYLRNCFYAVMTSDIGLDLPRVQRKWWNATAGLNCLAARGCPFGPLNGVLPTTTSSDSSSDASAAATKMVIVSTNAAATGAAAAPSLSFVFTLVAAQWTGSLLFTFGVSRGDDGAATSLQTGVFAESTPVADIRTLVLSTLVGLELGDVAVSKSWSVDTAAWTLQIDLSSLLFVDVGARFLPADDQQFATPPTVQATTGPFAELQIVALNASLVQRVTTCSTCSLHLESCQRDPQCRTQALPCLYSALTVGLKGVGVDTLTQYDATSATYRVRATELLRPCFRQVAPTVMEPLRRALLCLARHRCGAGSSSIDAARQTTFVLQNGSQSLLVPAAVTWTDADDASVKQSAIALRIADPFTGAMAEFNASSAALGSFLQSFVLRSAVDDVAVTVSRKSDTQLALSIVYSNTLLPNPQIVSRDADASTFAVVSDVASELWFQFPQSAMFSVDGVVAALKTYAAEPIGPTHHAWTLAPECLQCSASLFGCGPDAVANQQCHYANAPATLATCLRTQVSPTTFQALLVANASQPRTVVLTAPVTRCVVQEIATWRQDNASAVVARRRALAQSLNCFASQRCPFGPLDTGVTPTSAVLLRASSFDHVLRVRIPSDDTPSFAVQLEFRLGDVVVGHAMLQGVFLRTNDVAAIVAALNDALAGTAISVAARDTTVTEEAAGIEWTLRVQYQDVVVPDFDVAIGAQTTPSRDIAEQIVLRSTPRLLVATRDVRKIFLPSEAPTPKPTGTLTPTPTPSSSDGTNTPTPSPTELATPTPTPSHDGTGTGTGSANETTTPTPSPSSTDPPTPTPLPSDGTGQETPTPTPTPIATPTETLTPTPSETTVTEPPTPTPTAPPTPAPAIDMAARCDDSFLPQCTASRFCRRVMAPCLAGALRNLASPRSTVDDAIDLAPLFRTCAASVDSASLLDWWAPLQQYVFCLVRYEVPVSSSQAAARTTLRFTSATRQYAYPAVGVDDNDRFRLEIHGGPGSAFYSDNSETYAFEGTPAELTTVLRYVTHGVASSASVQLKRNQVDAATHLLEINLGAPFLGAMPFMALSNVGYEVQELSNQPAKLGVVVDGGTPTSTTIASWDRLIDRIAAIAATTEPPVMLPPQDPCNDCSDRFLSSCVSRAPCDAVVTCLQDALFKGNATLYNAHFDVLTVLRQCISAQAVTIDSVRELHDFVTCVVRSQCSLGQRDDGLSTYLVLISARDVLASASSSLSTSVNVELRDPDGVTAAEPFIGTLDALGAALVTRTKSLANVTLFVAPSSSADADGSFATEIRYDGYLGSMPEIVPISGLLHGTRREPAMLFAVTLRETGAPKLVSPPSLSAFNALVTKWRTPWETLCAPYLARCSRQLESLDGLTCRETILPCLVTILTTDLAPAVADPASLSVAGVVYNATERRLDFTERLRQCAPGVSIAAFQPIAQYLGCVSRVKGALRSSFDSSSYSAAPATRLELRTAKQTLSVASDADQLRIFPPGNTNRDANNALEANFVSNLNTARVLRYWVWKFGVDMAADVSVSQHNAVMTTDAGTGQTTVTTQLDIVLNDYIGLMPVIDESAKVTRGAAVSASLALVFPSDDAGTRDWSRLTAQLAAARLPDVWQRDCSSCATKYLVDCRVCRTAILPCLVSQLEQFATGSSANDIWGGMIYPCVPSTVRYVQLLPMVQFFRCYATLGCSLDPADQAADATFVVLQPARQTLRDRLYAVASQPVEIIPPNEVLKGSLDFTQVVSSTVSRKDTFREIVAALEAMLTLVYTGGSSSTSTASDRPRVSASEREGQPESNAFDLVLQYDNYTGQLPLIRADGLAADTTSARVFFTGRPPLMWVRFLNNLKPLVQDPVVVLTGSCATCARALFGCQSEANVSDASCSFQAPNSAFSQCLAGQLSAGAFQSVVSTLTALDITSVLSTCFSNVQAIDQANANAFAWDELWYAASEALQCMTRSVCPMGPLPASLSSSNMVVIAPPPTRVWRVRIDAASFRVRLLIAYGYRQEQTEWFDDTAPSDDIRGLLYPLVPISATVNVASSFDGSSWTFDLSFDGIFIPSMYVNADAGDSGVSLSVSKIVPWSLQLVAAPIESSKMKTIY
ncbi:hypothetical protein PINS_up000677 [Pythium insidiosum]|nr:hypothetical protein PINS_up000677 [Pythium insidiosum]